MTPLISLIIPTINQVKLVVECLDSLFKKNQSLAENFPFEVIVIDDGSPKPIQQQLKNALKSFSVRLILKNTNTGFATTVNQGIQASQGQFIILVNNDVKFVSDQCIKEMVTEAQNHQGCVIGARLLYPDGRIQHGGIFYRPAKRIFDHEYRHKPGNFPPALQTREVFGVTGALMLFDQEARRRLGGLDERFFLSWEDVDFCMRAWAAGLSVIYLGKAFAVHAEGKTRFNRASPKLAFWHRKEIETKQRFYAKWSGKLASLNGVKPAPSGSISVEQAKKWRSVVGPSQSSEGS